jgi:ketopantoate reductase
MLHATAACIHVNRFSVVHAGLGDVWVGMAPPSHAPDNDNSSHDKSAHAPTATTTAATSSPSATGIAATAAAEAAAAQAAALTTPAAAALAAALQELTGLRVTAAADAVVLPRLWRKLAVNASINAATALARVRNGALVAPTVPRWQRSASGAGRHANGDDGNDGAGQQPAACAGDVIVDAVCKEVRALQSCVGIMLTWMVWVR